MARCGAIPPLTRGLRPLLAAFPGPIRPCTAAKWPHQYLMRLEARRIKRGG